MNEPGEPAQHAGDDAMAPTVPPAGLVADAFGLGTPIGPLRPVRHVSQETWRLDAAGGSALVKRFWRGPEVPWRDELEQAMEVERRALEAGVDTPSPLPPREPQFGAVAHVPGHGVFRAYPYLTDHRPYEPAEDLDTIAEWVGTTLATVHQLSHPLREPGPPNWWYTQFPPVTDDDWRRWLHEASTRRRPWAGALQERFALILDLSARLVEAYASKPPHVLTHRDFEPWNVLMVTTGSGWRPVLIDWDVAGPDSAPLETVHVLTRFASRGSAESCAEPGVREVAALECMLEAYAGAGGHAFGSGGDLAIRPVGTALAHVADQLRSDLDTTADRPSARGDAGDRELARRLEALPQLVERADCWAAVFG